MTKEAENSENEPSPPSGKVRAVLPLAVAFSPCLLVAALWVSGPPRSERAGTVVSCERRDALIGLASNLLDGPSCREGER
jgi:hypothetical protein